MLFDLDVGGGTGERRLAPGLLASALAALTSLGRADGQFSVIADIRDPSSVVPRPEVHFGYSVEVTTGRIIPPGGGPPQAEGRIIAALRIDLPATDQDDLPSRLAALRDILLELSAFGWAIQAQRFAASALPPSVGEIGARPEDLEHIPGLPDDLDGRGVLVGVVDFGCDFAHPVFRDATPPGGTRLRVLWDQNAVAPPGAALPGRVITAAEIDLALAAADPYAALGYRPWENGYGSSKPEKVLNVHGTHVLGVAAGRDGGPLIRRELGPGVAPGAALGFVHLRPGALVSDGDATDVLDGICLLFQTAHEAGLPAVVNLSLGANTGGHDGLGLLDQAMDALLEAPGRAIAVAAGNNHEAGIAWRGKLSAARPARIGWRFRAADKSTNILRIYAAHGGMVPPPALSLTRPDGTPALPDDAMREGAAIILDAAGGIAGVYSFLLDAPSTDAPLCLHEVRLRPSGTREEWQIELTLPVEGTEEAEFNAWIERDDVSAFDISRFEPVPEGEALACTLGSLACAARPVSVGAYDRSRKAAAKFSSHGPTRAGLEKPDLVAPGTEIFGPAARGGQRTPQGVAYKVAYRANGTSAAAPHVAGVIALMFQLRPKLTADRICEILRATTRERQADPQAVWDPALGCGRVDAGAALALTLGEAP